MTNAEKFKEVFGFYPNANEDESVCNFMICEDVSCVSCKYLREDGTYVKWGDEITTNPRLQSFEIPVLKRKENKE